MSDLIAINAGAFNLAIQALKRAGKDEIAEQLESDCECVPDLIEQQQTEINALKAHVERFRAAILTPPQNDDDEWCNVNKVALQTPHQNLNAVRREVAKEAILAAIEDYKRKYCGQGVEALTSSFADIYPTKRYPDKE